MADDVPPIPDGYEEVPPEAVDGECLAFDPFTANDSDLWEFRLVTKEVAAALADAATSGDTRREAWYDVYQHGGYLNRRVPVEGDHNIRFVRPAD